MRKLLLIAISFLFSTTLFAQTVVKGNVKDAKSGEPLPGVNIKVAGKSLGTTTDFDGKYTLTVKQEPPFKIEYTTLGYAKQTVEITSKNQVSDVSLEENASVLDEIVVSASRTPESVRESPVTIERMDVRDIQKTASASFYNSIENLKGVDINTSSLTFNSVNTRGFATFANTRFVQLIDGMDNASPALNFVMGNLIGINELDVNSIELLPGASSALYGANAFNGILFMTSKNPFEHQGISAYIKKGITSSEAGGQDAYTDFGVRVAHAFSEKFAAKASFSYLDGTDWVANDTNQYGAFGTTSTPGMADEVIANSSPYAHNAINVYGDEAATSIKGVGQTLVNLGVLPNTDANANGIPDVVEFVLPNDIIGRRGYAESDITDYEAKSIKTDVSLNYRPFGNDLEIIGNYRVGLGNTIYQGANRYQLENFIMQQMRIEIKNDDFFVRAYRSTEDAGDSYDMIFTGLNIQNDFKANATWFGEYTGTYVQMFTGNFANPALQGLATSLGFVPGNTENAHALGRIVAENRLPNGDVLNPSLPSRYIPGTPEYQAAFDRVISNPDTAVGSKFIDNTSMNVAEGNYNFKSLLDDAIDLQVGGNYRQYSLDSQGTIFTDYDGAITYNEYGAYIQAVKKFLDDRLKLAGSIRMDKNEYFDANISPRLSVNYAAGDSKQHNFRASYQTGFKNPTTQDLFIGFDVQRAVLVGSSPDNLDRTLPNTTITGRDVYTDSYTASSVAVFSASGNPADLVPTATDLVQPEKVTAFDVGYRGKLGEISIDLNGYYNIYEGFINNKTVVTPEFGSTSDMTGVIDLANGNFRAFQTYTNSKADVSSYGAVIGLSTRVGNGFKIGLNYTYAKLDFDQTSEPDFTTNFNTPEHKIKFSFGNSNVYKNLGFNINARWQDEFLWESTIANALVESRFVADAQLNYTIPKWKSNFKIGGSNLGGKDYRSAPGVGNVGSQYYISWTINP